MSLYIIRYIDISYVIFMSTLTPGDPRSLYMMAVVEMISTNVAVSPPWRVPPRLVCSSSTFISHTTLPGLADKTLTYGRREYICHNSTLTNEHWHEVCSIHMQNCTNTLTLLMTLSKPGVSVIDFIICLSEFKVKEAMTPSWSMWHLIRMFLSAGLCWPTSTDVKTRQT
jgi:hypothetical protein